MQNYFLYVLLLAAAVSVYAETAALHAADALPSWNEGEAKAAIVTFVDQVTHEGSEHFVPAENRIATFDQDGTLWVEQPLYTQLVFGLDKIRSFTEKNPELKAKEPFKSILKGDLDHLQKLSPQEIEQLLALAFTGMTVDEFHREVSEWLLKATHPKFKKPYTDLVYQPMLEVIQLLKRHHFKVYIVSGGGQEFIRPYSEKVYGIPSQNIIGSAGKVKYEYRSDQPILLKIPQVLFVDDKEGKPESINLFIGKRPIAAFGNSDGDRQMLEWSQSSLGKSLQLLVHHDDPMREYKYDTDSKVGKLSRSVMEEANSKKWTVVSMKNDWKTIFSENKN